jgi:hypothetical protein
MSKVLTVVALSLLATTAANAMSSRPHSTYQAASVNNHQTNKVSSDPASPAAAPEIDPGSAISAFTLLAGGLAMIRGRRTASKRD